MLNSKRTIHNLSDLTKIHDSLCLWIVHADKIPPHIGISQFGKFFSLKANGKDEAVDIELVTQVLNSKGIRTLIYTVSTIDSLNLKESFEDYSQTVPGKITCLNPIKEILNMPSAERIHDVLVELEGQDRIIDSFGLNIDSNFKGIQDYQVSDIHNRLTLLNGKD